MSKIETITAERLDRLVDEGKEDVLQYFDLDNGVRLGRIRRFVCQLHFERWAGTTGWLVLALHI